MDELHAWLVQARKLLEFPLLTIGDKSFPQRDLHIRGGAIEVRRPD